jgi:Cu/Ag efflux protein CusF
MIQHNNRKEIFMVKRLSVAIAVVSMVLAAHFSFAEDEAPADKPKPTSGKSQGEIVELKLESRELTILFSGKRVEYKVAENASIKTHEKEDAKLEDLKVGDRINFWFKVAADDTKTIERIVPKGSPKSEAAPQSP